MRGALDLELSGSGDDASMASLEREGGLVGAASLEKGSPTMRM